MWEELGGANQQNETLDKGNRMKQSSVSCTTVSRSYGAARQRLSRFAIAAMLAGVGLLALVSPSQAEVVYTKVNITIYEGTYNLDLNGDGVTDFTIRSVQCKSHCLWYVTETPASGNGALLGPLAKGDEIGPDQTFDGATGYLEEITWPCYTCHFECTGPWCGGQSGYLGLSFQLNGETFYGWAELGEIGGGAVPLLGYAYETIPGKAITAGKKKGK